MPSLLILLDKSFDGDSNNPWTVWSHCASSGVLQALSLESKCNPVGQETSTNLSWLQIRNEEHSNEFGTIVPSSPGVHSVPIVYNAAWIVFDSSLSADIHPESFAQLQERDFREKVKQLIRVSFLLR